MRHNKKKKNIRKLAVTTTKTENSPQQQQKWMRQQQEEEDEDRLQLQAATGTDILNIARNRKSITARRRRRRRRRRRTYSIAIIASTGTEILSRRKTGKKQKKLHHSNNKQMRRIPASTCLNAASDVGERANPLRPGHRLGTDDTENTSAIVDLHCQARHSHRASPPSSSDRSVSPLLAFLVNRRKLHSRVSSPYLGTQPPPSLPSSLAPFATYLSKMEFIQT